jgi:hypothetical protein
MTQGVYLYVSPRSGRKDKAQGEAASGTLGCGVAIIPASRAGDRASIICRLFHRLGIFPGLFALGFILSPAPQAVTLSGLGWKKARVLALEAKRFHERTVLART